MSSSLNVWREQIGRHLMRLDFDPASDRPFQARVEPMFISPSMRLIRCTMSPGEISRSSELAKHGDATHTLLITRKRLRIRHRGRELNLLPGEATVLRDFEAGAMIAPDGVAFTAVTLPLLPQIKDVFPGEEVIGRRIESKTEALKLLCGYIGLISRTNWQATSPAFMLECERHLLELVRLSALKCETVANAPSRNALQQIRLKQILEQIEVNCCEPELTPDRVAQKIAISRRYLFSLLKSAGISFSQRLLQARLTTAHAMLLSPSGRCQLISEIAFNSGFSDLSHFNRCFRDFYGVCPSDVRRTVE